MQETRISGITAFFLISTAVLFDAAQFLVAFIPFVDIVLDWLLGAFAACVFGVWFLVLGVNYFQGKKALAKIITMFSSVVIELVPIVDALPAITLGVVTLIFLTWAEDRENAKEALQSAQNLAGSARGQYRRREQQATKIGQAVTPSGERESRTITAKERAEARRKRSLERFGYSPGFPDTPKEGGILES
jgi:hypothetical protein